MVFEVIADHDPELVGLQEPELLQIQELREQFPEYHFVGHSGEVGATADARTEPRSCLNGCCGAKRTGS